MSYIQTLQSAATAHLDELWYVGRTTNILDRFARHQKGSGARCLSGRNNIVMTKLEQEVPFLELTRTLDLMSRYGPSKVRGGPFVKQMHSAEDLAMIKILLDSESFARKSDDASSQDSEIKTEKRKREDDVHSTDTLSVTEGQEPSKSQARAGKPWTAEEHTSFRNLILDGASRDIAEMKMQRKHTALDAMARKLIASRMSSGHSLEEIGTFLKKTPEQIQSVLSGSSFFE